MTKLAWIIAAVAAAVALTVTIVSVGAMPPTKVRLCHVPPGEPGQVLELDISEAAVDMHLNNHPGDFPLDETALSCEVSAPR